VAVARVSLRAIPLWNAGNGTIRPELDQILFLPQRPYMVLGRYAINSYPHTHVEVEDQQLKQPLSR